jgi:hypothetical protein
MRRTGVQKNADEDEDGRLSLIAEDFWAALPTRLKNRKRAVSSISERAEANNQLSMEI